MMGSLLTGFSFLLSLVILFRLFTFERQGARFRRSVSVAATVIMMACITIIVHTLSGDFVVQPQSWPMVLMQLVVATALIRSRGNLAPILFGNTVARGS